MDSFYVVAACLLLTFRSGAPVTYHWSLEPDRFVKYTNVTLTFWLEGFTEPVEVVTLRKNIGKTIIFQDCSTMSPDVRILTCDNLLHKFSIMLMRVASEMRLEITAVTQNPAISGQFNIKPSDRPRAADISPDFHGYDYNYYVSQQVTLSCLFFGGDFNAGYFTWRRINPTRNLPSKAVIGASRQGFIKKKAENYGSDGHLKFQAEAGDEGWYQCLGVYDPSEVGEFLSRPIYIDVFYPPQMNLTQPYTIYQEASVGEKVTLVGSVISNPEPDELWWFKAEKNLTYDPRFGYWRNKSDKRSEYGLEFTVTEADYGVYHLIVNNKIGRGDRYFRLAAKSSSPSPSPLPSPSTSSSPWMSATIALLVILVLVVVCLILLLLYNCRRVPRREETSVRPPATIAMDNERSQLPSSRVTKMNGEKGNEIYMKYSEAILPGHDRVTKPPNQRYTEGGNVTEMQEHAEGYMVMAAFPPPKHC